MFFGVWALIITFISNARHAGAIGVIIPFWWFFGLIDAVRQAKAINATGLPESNLIGAQEKPLPVSSSLAFGVFLILFGIFFLVDRFVTIDLSFLSTGGPFSSLRRVAGLHVAQVEAGQGHTGAGAAS
jgi:hypothetical protein